MHNPPPKNAKFVRLSFYGLKFKVNLPQITQVARSAHTRRTQNARFALRLELFLGHLDISLVSLDNRVIVRNLVAQLLAVGVDCIFAILGHRLLDVCLAYFRCGTLHLLIRGAACLLRNKQLCRLPPDIRPDVWWQPAQLLFCAPPLSRSVEASSALEESPTLHRGPQARRINTTTTLLVARARTQSCSRVQSICWRRHGYPHKKRRTVLRHANAMRNYNARGDGNTRRDS